MQITQKNGPFSQGIKLTTDNGTELTGVTAVDIRIRPNDIIMAEIEVAVEQLDTQAKAEWYCHNPVTGGLQRIKRIEFEDGDTFEAADYA